MDFKEWVDQTIPMTDAEKNFAWFAWEAATKAEREACAKVCEELRDDWGRAKIGAKDGRYDMMEEAASICEDEIRKRSNA